MPKEDNPAQQRNSTPGSKGSSNKDTRVRLALDRQTSARIAHIQSFRREQGMVKEASLEQVVRDAVELLHEDLLGS